MKVLLIITGMLMAVVNPKEVFSFNSSSDMTKWLIINDGVMGGLSKGQFAINDSGNGVFWGTISLDNNGGFSSVRYQMASMEVNQYEHIAIRLKGDGKRYQLRVKTSQTDRHSYIQYFETNGEWQEVVIALSDMYPSFRGRKLNMPNYPGQKMSELTFLIANYKTESFRLEIDKIQLK